MIVSSISRRNNKQMEIYNIRSEIWSEHNNNNEQKQKKNEQSKMKHLNGALLLFGNRH